MKTSVLLRFLFPHKSKPQFNTLVDYYSIVYLYFARFLKHGMLFVNRISGSFLRVPCYFLIAYVIYKLNLAPPLSSLHSLPT